MFSLSIEIRQAFSTDIATILLRVGMRSVGANTGKMSLIRPQRVHWRTEDTGPSSFTDILGISISVKAGVLVSSAS